MSARGRAFFMVNSLPANNAGFRCFRREIDAGIRR